eukprot:gene33632-45044_t
MMLFMGAIAVTATAWSLITPLMHRRNGADQQHDRGAEQGRSRQAHRPGRRLIARREPQGGAMPGIEDHRSCPTDADTVDRALKERLIETSSSLLPAGLDSENNILSCFSQVYDTLNANTSAYFGTKVSHGAATFSLEFKSTLVNSNNISSMSLDDVRRGNALSAYVLNFINCSAAPNCTQLHRLPCRRTINTCGSCKSSEFT